LAHSFISLLYNLSVVSVARSREIKLIYNVDRYTSRSSKKSNRLLLQLCMRTRFAGTTRFYFSDLHLKRGGPGRAWILRFLQFAATARSRRTTGHRARDNRVRPSRLIPISVGNAVTYHSRALPSVRGSKGMAKGRSPLP